MTGLYILRATALIFAIMFGLMGWLQIDDPDNLIWLGAYAVAAIVALLVVFGVPSRIPLIILIIGFSIWSFTLSDGLSTWLSNHSADYIFAEDSTQYDYMERSRECLGLAVVVVGFLWLLIVDAFNNR